MLAAPVCKAAGTGLSLAGGGGSSSDTPRPARQFTCLNCLVKFDSIDSQKAHFKTDWHLYNLKRKVCQFEPIDFESFLVVKASQPAEGPTDTNELKSAQNLLGNDLRLQNNISRHSEGGANSSGQIADDTESAWDDVEEIDDEDLDDEDYSEGEAAEMLANVIKPNTCLFCDKQCADASRNLAHMNAHHGFFVPEEQYLIDLEGILEYLGFKVGAGATCLWCNKQFTSKHGVRLHMLSKDHCKILFDQQKAVDEFKEFYDYSTQELIPMKPLSQLAVPSRRFERRQDHYRSRAMAREKQTNSRAEGGKQLVLARQFNPAAIPGSFQAKNVKKFNSYRAKILLRTGMANNFSMRGRLRQQNPI